MDDVINLHKTLLNILVFSVSIWFNVYEIKIIEGRWVNIHTYIHTYFHLPLVVNIHALHTQLSICTLSWLHSMILAVFSLIAIAVCLNDYICLQLCQRQTRVPPVTATAMNIPVSITTITNDQVPRHLTQKIKNPVSLLITNLPKRWV